MPILLISISVLAFSLWGSISVFSPENLGFLSACLIVGSGLPYAIGAWKKTIDPNLTSWTLWSLIGLTILLNYKSAGADENLWIAVGTFVDPLIVVGVMLWRIEWKFEKPNKGEWRCIIISLLSLGGWWLLKDKVALVQITLYLAIIADLSAATPTIRGVWTKPESDRPLAWTIFSFGHLIGMFSVTDHTVANYSLPVAGLFIGLTILCPVVSHRIINRESVSQWL